MSPQSDILSFHRFVLHSGQEKNQSWCMSSSRYDGKSVLVVSFSLVYSVGLNVILLLFGTLFDWFWFWGNQCCLISTQTSLAWTVTNTFLCDAFYSHCFRKSRSPRIGDCSSALFSVGGVIPFFVGIFFSFWESHSLISMRIISSFYFVVWTNMLLPSSILKRVFSISVELWIK
jgi:hypothetical protein